MKFQPTRIPEVVLIDPEPRGDERGFFARAFCVEEFAANELETRLVQSNVSRSREVGTLRGMHYQLSPREETKLVRCTAGAIFDVVVDVRPESPTRGQWVGAELSAENLRMLYVPRGFAHGFLTLRPDSEVFYHVSEFYAPECERGYRYDDPAFGIEWPGEVRILSPKDAGWPAWRGDS